MFSYIVNCDVTIVLDDCHKRRMGKEEFTHKVLPIRSKLASYALSFLKDRDESEDIIQEVYVKLWCMRDRLGEYKSIDALSFAITRNLCLNRIKVKQRQLDSETSRIVISSKDEKERPDDLLIEKDDLNQALLIVEQLPSLQQAILKMRHIEGLEIAEIAELIGSNVGAVRTNLSRARNKVKSLFMEMNGL